MFSVPGNMDRDTFVGGNAPQSLGEERTTRPAWQLDKDWSHCGDCKDKFDSFFTRKHHCRSCGYIFCGNCTKGRALLPVIYEQKDPQRVCKACRMDLEPHQRELAEMNSNSGRDNAVDMSEGSYTRYMNMPYSSTLGSEIRKSTYSLRNMFNSDWLGDRSIPARLLRDCAGIAFMTVVKAGFLFAGKVGTGLVIGKLPDGSWSAPSAIGTMGMSWGLLIGADVTDFVMILNNQAALRAFSGVGNMQLGVGVDVALGPVGRGANASAGVGDKGAAAVLSYSHSKGLFAGLTLDGAFIATRRGVNFKFYGRHIDPMEILTGNIPQPKAGGPLYEALDACIVGGDSAAVDENNEADAYTGPPALQGSTVRGQVIGESDAASCNGEDSAVGAPAAPDGGTWGDSNTPASAAPMPPAPPVAQPAVLQASYI